jgi:hypothetical protein
VFQGRQQATFFTNPPPTKPMTTLTDDQISSAAGTARNLIMQNIDSYVNKAITELGINPIDISEEQYSTIIDNVFE